MTSPVPSSILPLESASALATAVADLVTTGRYCTLASWVLLLYDHAVHLDKEIELFWNKPWSAAKLLYFYNRYASAIFLGIHTIIFLNPNVTDQICLNWFKFEGYTGVSSIASVELILAFRVLALWNRNKWILAVVAIALFAEIAAMLGILTATYIQLQAFSQPDPSIPYKACIPSDVSPYIFAFWLPPLGYEFLVFILAATKGYSTLRNAISPNEFTVRSTGGKLMEVMIRDSHWYFLLIFACDMVCTLIWLKGPDSLLQAVVGFGLVIPSIAASHLLLNLRQAYFHPGDITMTNGTVETHLNTTTGFSDPRLYGKGGEPSGTVLTFGRSNDVQASARRSRVRPFDTQWALDPEQDEVSSTVHDAKDESKLERGGNIDVIEEGDAMELQDLSSLSRDPNVLPNQQFDSSRYYEEGNVLPSSTRRAPPYGDVASIVVTTATISTFDADQDEAARMPRTSGGGTDRPSMEIPVVDTYSHSVRNVSYGAGRSRRPSGGGRHDADFPGRTGL